MFVFYHQIYYHFLFITFSLLLHTTIFIRQRKEEECGNIFGIIVSLNREWVPISEHTHKKVSLRFYFHREEKKFRVLDLRA